MSRDLHDHFFREAKRQGYLSRAAFKLIEIDERKRVLRRGDWVLDAGCAPGSWLQVIAERIGPPAGKAKSGGKSNASGARGGFAPRGDASIAEASIESGPTEGGPTGSGPTGGRPNASAPGESQRDAERRDAAARGGRVVGIDLKEVDGRRFGPHVRVLQGDISDVKLGELLGDWRDERPDRPPFDVMLSDMGPDTTGDRGGDSLRSMSLCHILLDRAPQWLRRGGHFVTKVYEGATYPELLARVRAGFDDVRGYKPEASRSSSVEIFLVAKGFRGTAPRQDAALDPTDPIGAELPRRRRSTGWT